MKKKLRNKNKVSGPKNAWFNKGDSFAFSSATKPKYKKNTGLKGHHSCPCGSGLKLKSCCRVAVAK